MNRIPEKVSDVLALAQKLLDAARPKDAVELIWKYGTSSAELSNAYGVALMRAGETAKAVELYRSLCLNESGLVMKGNLPTAFKANYATALLLANNVVGCVATLREIKEKDDPYLLKLHAAIDRWRRSLGWWQRLTFDWFSADLGRPVPLDFPPGELATGRQLQPAA